MHILQKHAKPRAALRALAALTLLAALLFALPVVASAEGYANDIEPHCRSLFLTNLDTGTVVYANNPDERLPMASVTKIMTYIVAYENISSPETTVINTGENFYYDLMGTGSSMAGLYMNEELTALQLYYMMLIPSGNDAAYVLAEYVGGGSVDAFVEMMNERAAEMGCTNTHFVDPSGLSAENHYSTAREIATIAQYALSLPYFSQITDSTYYTLPPTNQCAEERTVYTTNSMLNPNMSEGAYYYEYARGIKTGTTDEAGYCVVTSAVRDGYSYLCVALGSPVYDSEGNETGVRGDMLDSRALFEWAFEQFRLKTVLSAGDILADVQLEGAWGKDVLQLTAATGCSALLPSEVETSSILMRFDVPSYVEAPVSRGQKIGSVTLRYADTDIRTIDLVAAETVERNDFAVVVDQGRELLTSPWFKLVAAVIGFLVVLYVILLIVYNVKRSRVQNQRQRKRY